MARAVPKVAAAAPDVAPSSKGSMVWVQGLACGALLTFAAPTALLIGVLLAPAVACLLGERGPGHTMTRAVALCCAAAALGPVWRLWMAGDHMEVAAALLSDPFTLVLAWGAGACAWALCQVLPVLIRTAWDLREAARSRSITIELDRCREEWDLDRPT